MTTRLVRIDDNLKASAEKTQWLDSRTRRFDRLSRPAEFGFERGWLRPISRPVLLLARLAARARMDRLALRLALASIGLDGRNLRAHWEFAKLLVRLERSGLMTETTEGIRELLRTSLDRVTHSTDPRIRDAARILLGESFYLSGRYADAIEAIGPAIPGRPEQAARALRIKANSLIALGKFDEAHVVHGEMLASDCQDTSLQKKMDLFASLRKNLAPATTAIPGGPCATLLIGIGGGIGDMLHSTPLIRNLAQRTGERVDLVVMPDHTGAEFLAENSEYVGRMWKISSNLLDTHYRQVFLTHSFGSVRLPFRADRICASQSWQTFRPGTLNETLFNLEAARHLLGIEFEPADAERYFVGNLQYRPPSGVLVGIHAGSKSGRWLSKRWPGFQELAAHLISNGIRVASFGTPDEYIDGTENRTGGTIEEMSRSILNCTHFVSNDSGPLHIASALGIPSLALFAPTDPMTHLPLRRTTLGLALKKRCAPCEVGNHGYFASGRCRCIGDISVADVENALLGTMSGFEPDIDGQSAL